MTDNTLLLLGLIGVASLSCQLIAWRFKIPSILFLLLTGMLLGPTFHIINPDTLFGNLLKPLISISVAIILFEGSLGLKFKAITNLKAVIIRLVTIGTLINWLLTAAALYLVAHLSLLIALLTAALLIVTGPTVIKPILEVVRPVASVEQILKWEGIILDSIGGLLAVVVFSFIISSHSPSNSLFHSFLQLVQVIVVGVITGFVLTLILQQLLKRIWLPTALNNFLVLNWVVISFMIANAFAQESGLITVTLMGIIFANQKSVNIESILEYKESLTILLLSAIFIILAARIDYSHSLDEFIYAIIMVFVIQFIIQPLKTILTLHKTQLNIREKILVGWIAPKGIISAALISLFTLQLTPMYPHLQTVNLVFYIILLNVCLISFTAAPLARKLRLAKANPNGVLIIGSSAFSRQLAIVLIEKKFEVIIADSNWDNLSAARLKNIPTYFGNPMSEAAEHNLSLQGIGMLLALSHNAEFNTLMGMRFQYQFGRHQIFYIESATEKNKHERHVVDTKHKGKKLFGKEITFQKLASMMSNNATVKCVKFTEKFTFENFEETNRKKFLPLFIITTQNILKPFTQEGTINIQDKDSLIYLLWE